MENDGMTRHKIKCQFLSEGDDSDPPPWDTLEYFCWPISLYCYWFCLAIPRRTHVRQDLWWGVNDDSDWMVEKNKLGVRNSPWAMCAWPSPAFRTGRCVGTSFSLLACFCSPRLSLSSWYEWIIIKLQSQTDAHWWQETRITDSPPK